MANQAGISRRFGGIHFIDGDVRARAAGALVGNQAWAKALSYMEPGKRARRANACADDDDRHEHDGH